MTEPIANGFLLYPQKLMYLVGNDITADGNPDNAHFHPFPVMH